MIPSGLTLADSTTATSFTTNVPIFEGATTTRYLVFYDTSFATSFTMRKRERVRASNSDVYGAWGDWSEWSESLTSGADGIRRSLTPFAWDTTTVSPAATNDIIQLEFQAKEAGGEWSASLITDAYYFPTVGITATLIGVTSISLSLDMGAWIRNGSTLTIIDIKQGSTIDPLSGLPSMLKSKPLVFDGLEVDATRDIPLSAFSLFPANNSYISIFFRFSIAGGYWAEYAVPILVTYAASNTPTVVLVPNHDAGTVSITVTDAGGAKPITGCSALMLGGMGDFDLIPLTVGAAATHYTPPLDKLLTYQIIAVASDGSRKIVEATTTVNSNGRAWFNWGTNYSESMDIRYNAEWSSDYSRDKTYFKPYSGLPKVFHSQTKSGGGSISGIALTSAYKTKAKALAESGKVVYCEPGGDRKVISIDNVGTSEGASKGYQIGLNIRYTEVSPWQ